MTFSICKKDNSVSYREIQNLLNEAHKSNVKNGLIYATDHQTEEELMEKIGDGVCFVAKNLIGKDPSIIGTMTICQKYIDYWYYTGDIYLLKLVGVHSEYKRMGVSQKLINAIIEYVKESYDNQSPMVIVTDSAENNLAFKNLVLKNKFKIVDCVKYKGNNFVSTVYAKWIYDDCPWTDAECIKHYEEHRSRVERQPERE